MSIKSIDDLKVYKESFDLAMEIFHLAINFPDNEKYSLTSQIIRSSRSVAAIIREGYAKKIYESVFIRHLVDALGSCEETHCLLDFAYQCKYVEKDAFGKLEDKYSALSAIIFNLQKNRQKIQ